MYHDDNAGETLLPSKLERLPHPGNDGFVPLDELQPGFGVWAPVVASTDHVQGDVEVTAEPPTDVLSELLIPGTTALSLER